MDKDYSAVLVRYGEIGIKSKQTRRRVVRLLVDSIRSALEEAGVTHSGIRMEYGRVFVETTDAHRVAETVSRVFGVVSASPVIQIQSDLDVILDVGFQVAEQEFVPGQTFAVRARRVGTHEYTSQVVREKLGARIFEGLPDKKMAVDLENPYQTLTVEVRNENAYLFTKTIEGFGGMPTGSQGKVVCTISTGLDSPVAAFKAMKRGCVPVFVYFDNTPYADSACADTAIEQATRLARFIHDFEVKMYIVPHSADLDEARRHCREKMTCIYCKRNMLRLAREIALIEDADAIVTGEIIGEQASQTTANLKAIGSAVCDIPVLRPCIGEDKVDIERMGIRIGTYDLAERSLTCCTLPPKYPIVNASAAKVLEIERDMDLSVLQQEIHQSRVVLLRSGTDARRKSGFHSE